MSYEIALQRIQECKDNNSTELDLSELGLTELPAEITKLQQLEVLIAKEKQIIDISSSQNKFKQGIDAQSIPLFLIKEVNMKYFIALLLFLSFFRLSYGQRHDNTWLLGLGFIDQYPQEVSYVVTFNPNYQQDTVTRNMGINAAQATISDTAGNLLFYSNNCLVNNHRHELMHNGDSLGDTLMWNFRGAGFGINDAIALPHPDSLHLFYLVHVSFSQSNLAITDKLYYSLIDMNAKLGLGEVRLKNQLLYQSTAAEGLDVGGLEACKHANGKDWWILQPLVDTLAYATFLIKGDSVIRYPNQYFSDRKSRTGGSLYAVFSPDGSVYAHADDKLNVYDFNRCTGKLSHRRIVPVCNGYLAVRGMAISPNSKFLYIHTICSLRVPVVSQFDLETDDVAASREVIIDNVWNDTICYYGIFCTVWTGMELAADGKIYASTGLNYLHVIHNPNQKGLACDARMNDVELINSTERDSRSLPNFPNYRLGTINPCVPRPVPNESGEVISSVAENEMGGIKLYPNPAKDRLILQQSIAFLAGTEVQIYNGLGQLVQSQVITNESQIVELNVSTLANSSYFVRIHSSKIIASKLFLISK